MTPPTVALDALLEAAGPQARLEPVPGGVARSEVRGVTHDSRAVEPGAMFCCVPGLQTDGHRFAEDAVRRGATVLLVERVLPLRVAQVVVPDVRAAMAPVAARYWDHPARKLTMAGVTGTNGKTTVVAMLAAIARAAGRRVATIGTLSSRRTTPEATDLQALLAGFVEDGVTDVAMEVSSHALALHRVDAVRFDVAVFTNLTRDHLDFHPTMEAYFAAKARLFEPDHAAAAVVNLEDPHGRLLQVAAVIPTEGFSFADAAQLRMQAGGSTFRWRSTAISLRLAGRHNVANALAAAAAAARLGIAEEHIAAGLASLERVRGRFEPVDAGQPYAVIVDYAHTPDALEQVLISAREIAAPGARVIVVFGCGGDRDRSKRAPMGEIAARLADVVVITSDNPRSEDPERIIAEVRAGTAGSAEVLTEVDRRAAFAAAFTRAQPGDVVLLAGKGHEQTQEFAGRTVEFDDLEQARHLLEAAS